MIHINDNAVVVVVVDGQAGARVCLGYRFALMEAMAVTAVLLKTVPWGGVAPDATLDCYYPGSLNFRKGVRLTVL